MVWLKLQPYVQSSLASRTNHKLAFKYFGPYEVESKIGSVAYKLKLPPGSSVHLVFHVSLLKPMEGQLPKVSPSLPPGDHVLKVPESILDRRMQVKNKSCGLASVG